MPNVHRKGDRTTHPCKPATYSGDVFANGRNVVRKDDLTDCGAVYEGMHNVYVNSRPVQVVGDPVSCGNVVATGSGDVYACGG